MTEDTQVNLDNIDQNKKLDRKGGFGDWTDGLMDLTPIDNVENFDTYEKALNWGFNKKRIKNIALSGPYGSGKSSIIETYLHRHEEVKNSAVQVSLASFTSVEAKLEAATTCEKIGQNTETSEEELEKAILKQLFYAVNIDKIPLSHYRRVHTPSRKECFKIWLKILFVVLMIVTVVNPNGDAFSIFDVFFGGESILNSVIRFTRILLFSAAISVCIYFLFKNSVSRIHINEMAFISKITVKSEEEDESVFNRNLDEIIYFFEETKFRYVFFEDLDRLNNIKIFIHLRELNHILNMNRPDNEETIRFVYAIRDDIFTAEDRTKFFDYIVPVIPVVSVGNSAGLLMRMISDTVKNNGDNWRENKGKITEGCVNAGIESKYGKVKNTEEINVGIDELCKNDEMTIDIMGEGITAEKIGKYRSKIEELIFDVEPFVSDVRVMKNTCNKFLMYKQMLKFEHSTDLDERQLFALVLFKNTCPQDFMYAQRGEGILEDLFTNKDKVIEAAREYLSERSSENGESVINQPQTSAWKNKLDRLDTMAISDFLGDKELKEFWPEELKSNKLLMFLLRKGYINGSYASYINYVKNGSLTINDIRFILSVKNQDPLESSYGLDNVSRVTRRLQRHEFFEEAVRNYDLLNYLLSNTVRPGENPMLEIYSKDRALDDKLKYLIVNLAEWAKTDYRWKTFFDGFREEYRWVLIRLLAAEWDGMLYQILGVKYPKPDNSTVFDEKWYKTVEDEGDEYCYIEFDESDIDECVREILLGCDLEVVKYQINFRNPATEIDILDYFDANLERSSVLDDSYFSIEEDQDEFLDRLAEIRKTVSSLI